MSFFNKSSKDIKLFGEIKRKYLKYKIKYLNLKYGTPLFETTFNGGSKYAVQEKIETMDEIPDLFYEGKSIKSNIHLKVNVDLMDYPEDLTIGWTNDLTNDLYKTINFTDSIKCNQKFFADYDIKNYSEGFYKYNCIYFKQGYQIEFNNQYDIDKFFDDNVKLFIDTPEFNDDTPYEFELLIEILGKAYNIYNIYISYNITKYVYEIIKSWITRKSMGMQLCNGCYYIENFNYQQIYFKNTNLDYDEQSFLELSDTKLQMKIKYEYIFWVSEKIAKNLDLLLSLDLNSYKFDYCGGNGKLEHIQEFFPDREKGEKLNRYVFNDKEYKRELFDTPNIVFYMNKRISPDNLNKLINTLINLFPDTLDLSIGHPRFNIRLSKNLFISVGGHNQYKYPRINFKEENIPKEYRDIIINCEKYTKEDCDRINSYTKNLSDHHLLKYENDMCMPNNILSYHNITFPYRSFEDLEHYINKNIM